MPFVKFVQHYGVDAREVWVGDQAAGQNALGEKTKPGSRAGNFFEPDLVTHGLAERLRHFLGYPARGQPNSQTPRLQHQYVSVHQIQQGRRNSSGFSRTRRSFDDEIRKARERFADARQQADDGEVAGYGFFSGSGFSGVLDGSSVSYLILVSLLNCL